MLETQQGKLEDRRPRLGGLLAVAHFPVVTAWREVGIKAGGDNALIAESRYR
jgi:hypothetical protein